MQTAGRNYLRFFIVIMADKYDVIIIGAGLGGLTAAARLIRDGKSVLILERNSHPGGTAYVYSRNGFIFPMGPLGFSNHKLITKILKDLGIENDLSWKRVKYCLKAFNLTIPLALPFPELQALLKKQFPAEINGINTFFIDAEKVIALFKVPGNGNQIELKGTLLQQPVAEYLDNLITDWKLKRILGSLGTSKPSTSFPLQAAMWNLMCQEGIWYPRGGFKKFCDHLASKINSEGIYRGKGNLKLGAEVERIHVTNRRVTGVQLWEGTSIDCDYVISNTDFKTTFNRLLGEDDFNPWYQTVAKAKQAGSILQVCLGTNKQKVDCSAFKEASRLLYRRTNNDSPPDDSIDWDSDYVDIHKLASRELEISLWSNEDENLAPDDSAAIVIRTEAPYSHFSRFRPGKGKRTPEYKEYKNRLGKAIIDEVKKLLPGIENGIEVMDIATPLTFEGQGGRSEGTVAGWSWDYKDFHDYKPTEMIRTPIRGLYMAGYQAYSALFLGGVPMAMLSGQKAAEAVIAQAGPVTEIPF